MNGFSYSSEPMGASPRQMSVLSFSLGLRLSDNIQISVRDETGGK